jgi:hypothetical protein
MKLNYLDLSTSHIKEENSNHVLETQSTIFNDIGLFGYPYDSGSFISVGEIEETDIVHLFTTGFDDVAKILRYCVDNQISLIRFDRDAEIMNEFKSYEW